MCCNQTNERPEAERVRLTTRSGRMPPRFRRDCPRTCARGQRDHDEAVQQRRERELAAQSRRRRNATTGSSVGDTEIWEPANKTPPEREPIAGNQVDQSQTCLSHRIYGWRSRAKSTGCMDGSSTRTEGRNNEAKERNSQRTCMLHFVTSRGVIPAWVTPHARAPPSMHFA